MSKVPVNVKCSEALAHIVECDQCRSSYDSLKRKTVYVVTSGCPLTGRRRRGRQPIPAAELAWSDTPCLLRAREAIFSTRDLAERYIKARSRGRQADRIQAAEVEVWEMDGVR